MSDKFHQPTFRLFVGHRRPLSTTEKQDLRALFESHGRVTNTNTQPLWSNSIISFATTREATLAKRALHGHAFKKDITLGIQYARQTRCVSVRGLPQGFSLDNVKQAFRRWDLEVVEREGNSVEGQEDVLVVFERLSDAGDAVATVKEIDGHALSYDFARDERRKREEEHKERPRERSPGRRRRRRGSPERQNDGSSRRRSRSRPSSVKDYERKREEHKGKHLEHSPAKKGNSEDRRNKKRSSTRHDDGFDDAWEALEEKKVTSVGSRSRSRSRSRSSNERQHGRRGRDTRRSASRTPKVAKKSRKQSTTPEDRKRKNPKVDEQKREDEARRSTGRSPELIKKSGKRSSSREAGERRSSKNTANPSSRSRYRDEEDSPWSIELSPSRSPASRSVGAVAVAGESKGSSRPSAEKKPSVEKTRPSAEKKKDGEERREQQPQEQEEGKQQPPPPQAVEPQQEDEGDRHCLDCERLLNDLKSHTSENHAIPINVQKGAVKAWFECHYTTNSEEKAENASAVPRKTLLDEINRFLEHMGWPKWKAQSNLYKDWFIPEVLKVNGADASKGRPWPLFARDGFAPGGNVDNARNQEQRLAEMMGKIRTFLEN